MSSIADALKTRYDEDRFNEAVRFVNSVAPPANPSGGAVLKSYTPTLGERLVSTIQGALFSDDREGRERAERVSDVLQFTPLGVAVDAYDAGRELGRGNLGGAAMTAAMAGMPGKSPKGIRA